MSSSASAGRSPLRTALITATTCLFAARSLISGSNRNSDNGSGRCGNSRKWPVPAADNTAATCTTSNRRAAQHLPRAVNIVHAPTTVPGSIVILRLDQVSNRLAHQALLRVKLDVAEKPQGARRQIAASRIEDGVVIGEGHVFQPVLRDFLI